MQSCNMYVLEIKTTFVAFVKDVLDSTVEKGKLCLDSTYIMIS